MAPTLSVRRKQLAVQSPDTCKCVQPQVGAYLVGFDHVVTVNFETDYVASFWFGACDAEILPKRSNLHLQEHQLVRIDCFFLDSNSVSLNDPPVALPNQHSLCYFMLSIYNIIILKPMPTGPSKMRLTLKTKKTSSSPSWAMSPLQAHMTAGLSELARWQNSMQTSLAAMHLPWSKPSGEILPSIPKPSGSSRSSLIRATNTSPCLFR